MEEKKELLKISEKKYDWLRRLVGRNIIEYFQPENIPSIDLDALHTQMHIEEILEEANSRGLRWEVDNWAKKLLKEDPQLDIILAYQLAFKEWIG